MEQGDSSTTKGGGRIPPYVSYKTFKTFIDDMATHNVPTRIDKSVLRRFNGSARAQLQTGLRFLDLVDAKDQPTDALRTLVAAHNSDLWPATLAAVLQDPYAVVMALDLAHVTDGQLREAFKTFPGTEEVLSKSRAFFLRAAKDAGIKLSPRIEQKAPRCTSPRRKAPNQNGAGAAADAAATPDAGARKPVKQVKTDNDKPNYGNVYDVLLSIWKPATMPKEVDAAVITLMRWLKTQEEEATSSSPAGA